MSIISNSNIGNLKKIKEYFNGLEYINYRIIENTEKNRYDVLISQKWEFSRVILNAKYIPSGCKIFFEGNPMVLLFEFITPDDYNKISKHFMIFNKSLEFRNCNIPKEIIEKYIYLDANSIKDCTVHISKNIKMSSEFAKFYVKLISNRNEIITE